MKISFAGCGFLGIYHLAVVHCLRENAPWLLEDVEELYGCSIGSVVAAALACEVSFMKEVKNAIVELVEKAHASPLIVLSRKFDVAAVVRRVVDRILPKDAHRRVRGRLRISVTEFPSLQNRILDDFNTRNELITVRSYMRVCVRCVHVCAYKLMQLHKCLDMCASCECVPCTHVHRYVSMHACSASISILCRQSAEAASFQSSPVGPYTHHSTEER